VLFVFSQALRFLLERGSNIAITNSSGATALHTAASNGSVECVRDLISRGLPIDTVDEDGRSARDKVKMRLAKPATGRLDSDNGNDTEMKDAVRRLEAIAEILEFPILVQKLKTMASQDWNIADMRNLIALAALDDSGLIERSDFETKCGEYLASIPAGVTPVKPRPRAGQSYTSTRYHKYPNISYI
jgi:hypothetical protein